MLWYLGYILVYLSVLITIAFYYYTRIKQSDDFIICGWNTGFWTLTGTIVSTCCGAAVFIGWVGMGFRVGLSGFFQFALPAYAFCLLFVIFFARPLRRQRMFTLPDVFGGRFGRTTAVVPSILSAIIYAVPTTAIQVVGISTILLIAFDVPVAWGVVIGISVMCAFTLLGGMPATIMTDALQSILLLVGILVLLGASLFYAGGPSTVLENTPRAFLMPLGTQGLEAVLLFALSVGPFYLVWQSAWQRVYVAKDEKTALRAGLAGYGISLLISVVPYTIGIIARGFVPADTDPNYVFSTVVLGTMPPWLGGIVYIGLIAALVTSGTSFIMQGSSNLVQDFYHKLIDPQADNARLMLISRLSVVAVCLGSLAVALFIQDIITLYQWALRLTGAMLVFPFLAIMLWPRVTRAGFMASMAVAGVVTLSFPWWPGIGERFDPALAGFPASLITLVVVSLLTRHAPGEQVVALCRGGILQHKAGDAQ